MFSFKLHLGWKRDWLLSSSTATSYFESGHRRWSKMCKQSASAGQCRAGQGRKAGRRSLAYHCTRHFCYLPRLRCTRKELKSGVLAEPSSPGKPINCSPESNRNAWALNRMWNAWTRKSQRQGARKKRKKEKHQQSLHTKQKMRGTPLWLQAPCVFKATSAHCMLPHIYKSVHSVN